MKTPRVLLLFGALVLCSFTAWGQNRPLAFLGVKWGAARGDVIRALDDAGASIPDEVRENADARLDVSGGSFAGQTVTAWSIEFVRGKFVAAAVTMKAAESGAVLFREMKQQLVKKYGPPVSEKKINTMTPEQKRNYLANGTRPPNQGTAATWKFTPNLQDKSNLTMVCELAPPAGSGTEDESQFAVTLRYGNESLRAQLDGTKPGAATPKPGTIIRGDL